MAVRLPELLSACIDLAAVASTTIRKLVATGGATLTADKSGGHDVTLDSFDPQTVADLTSQHVIIDSLRARWPGLCIIGEEGALTPDPTLVHKPRLDLLDAHMAAPRRPGWDAAWDTALDYGDVTVFVDPLDGTREFTEGIHSAVTVLVGIAYHGHPVAGVIQQPWLTLDSQRCFWGCVGLGVHVQEQLKGDKPGVWTEYMLPAGHDPERRIIGTSRSHNRPEIDLAIAAVKPTDVIRTGGAGNKVIQLLEGEIDCYLYPVTGTKRWDTCAGEAVLLACGGILTDKDGSVYKYDFDGGSVVNDGGVIAVLHKDSLPMYVEACRAGVLSPSHH